MSTHGNDERELTLTIVLDRVREASGAKNDAELARVLFAQPTNIAAWKQRGTIPWKNLVEYAMEYGISLNWLIEGEGPQSEREALLTEVKSQLEKGEYPFVELFADGVKEPSPTTDLELLEHVVRDLLQKFQAHGRMPDPAAFAKLAVAVYQLSAEGGKMPPDTVISRLVETSK